MDSAVSVIASAGRGKGRKAEREIASVQRELARRKEKKLRV